MVASETDKGLAESAAPVCTSVCTSEAENAHESAAAVQALALINSGWESLPDATKAAILDLMKSTETGQSDPV
jgi:hypothetical protein